MIVSYMMLNLPSHEKSNVLGGIICLTGQGYPAVRSIAMVKDSRIKNGFDKEVLRSFSFEQAEKEANNDPLLRPLFERLLEEEKRNTKPEQIRQYFNFQTIAI